MKRLSLLAIALVLALPANASPSPVREHVAMELPIWGFKDVDVDGLSSAQVMRINHLLHSNGSPATIRSHIGSVLGNSILKSLFGR